MLDEFRSTNITWDKATRRIYSPITANASDSNGRKLNIQVVNSGQVKNLTGATLHLYWETKDKTQHGLDAFTASDISKGEFEIFYTTGMLSNVGELNATLVLVDSTGKVVSDWFKITVTRGINEGAIESENSFSSLTQALIDISNLEQNYAPRLNDLTAQLQQKANQTDVRFREVKLGQNDMSDEFLQQMAGNTPVNATVNKGSITRDRLTQRLIGDGQTDFLTRGKNLFDKDNLTTGYAIDNTGALFSSVDYSVTDYLNIEPNKNYTVNARVFLALYDANFNFISRPLNDALGTFLTPADAIYMRVSVFTGSRSSLQVEQGDIATGREDYSIYMDKLKFKPANFSEKTIPIEALEKGSITRDRLAQSVIGAGQTDFIKTGKNLYDKDNLTAGYAINASGELFPSSTHYVTDFINILPNTTYHADNNNVMLALYDSSFSFISRPLNNTAGAFTTPENAVYARIAIFSGARTELQLEQGDKATTREDYIISMDKLKLREENFQNRIIETESLKSLEVGKNLFDISKATEVGAINMVNGIVDSSLTNFSTSPFIEIDSNANYSKSHAANFAFFDEKKAPITIGIGTGEGQYSSAMVTFTPPAEGRYIRISVREDRIDAFQFEQSTSPTDFEPYGYRLKELLYDNDISDLKDQINKLGVVSSKPLKYPTPAFIEPNISLIGGTSRSVAFVDSEDNLWAIQWDNKIYKNPVNTTTWEMVLDAEPFLERENTPREAISGYALVVSDTGRIVVATSHGRVLVSDEEQTTLTETFTFKGGFTQTTWGFDKQGQYILMGSYLVSKNAENPGREVYLSKDHGETWELIFDMPIGEMTKPADYHIHDVAFDPYSKAILVVQGDTVNNQIYYSYDFGSTWKEVNPEGTSKVHPTSILCFPEGIAFGSDELPEGISWWDRPADETEPDIKHDDIYWKKKFNLGESIIGNIAVKGATLFDESGLYGVIGFMNHNTTAPGYPRLFATGDGGRSWHQIWKSDNQTDENGFFNTLLRKTDNGIEIYSRYSIGGQPRLFKANMPTFIEV